MSSFEILLTQHGVLLVLIASFAARAGLPVPAAPLVVVAGALSVSGTLPFWPMAAASIVGNLLGDAIWFVAGRSYGHRVMRLLCRLSLSPDSCVRQSETLIARWGGSALIAGKFVPGVSAVAPPMAGALGMSLARFAFFDLAGAITWTFFYALLGVAFNKDIQTVLSTLADVGLMGGAALVAVLGLYLLLRLVRRRHARLALSAPRLSAQALREWLEQGVRLTLIDVRSAASVALDPRRIPGALAIELKDIPARAGELAPDVPVVLYCNCPNEASAAQAARMLRKAGILECRLLTGGLDAWGASGGVLEVPPGSCFARLSAVK